MTMLAIGLSEFWNVLIMDCWNVGMLECLYCLHDYVGMLEYWNIGLLLCWNIEMGLLCT